MHFNLAYKTYEYKASQGALRSFEEDTGESMLGILNGLINVYYEVDGLNSCAATSSFLSYCPEIIGSKIFYYLAKEKNSMITLEEIQDAVFHASHEIPKEVDSMDNPWYLVLVKVGGDIIKQLNSNNAEKKKLSQNL